MPTGTAKTTWTPCWAVLVFRTMKKALVLLLVSFLAVGAGLAAEDQQIKTKVQTPWEEAQQEGLLQSKDLEPEPAPPKEADAAISVEPAEPKPQTAAAASPKGNDKSATKPTPPTAASGPAKADAKAEAKTDAKSPVKQLESAPPKPRALKPFWVQVGAFTQEDNAARLNAKLQSQGYNSFMHLTKDLDRQVFHLVLIGDFAQEKEAIAQAEAYTEKEEAKSVVIKDGAIIRVFTPQAPLVLQDKIPRVYARPGENDPDLLEIPESIYKPTHPPDADFVFQVGGLYKEGEAKTLMETLRKRGYKPTLTKKQDINGLDWWFTVQIGYFYTQLEAEAAATAFFDKENLRTSVPKP